MKDASAAITYLKDYQAPAYHIESVDLCFRLFEDGAEVRNRMQFKKDPAAGNAPLVLDGEELELRSVCLDGGALSQEAYDVSESSLTLNGLPDSFELELVTWIKPQENKRLEGLYRSSVMFCTPPPPRAAPLSPNTAPLGAKTGACFIKGEEQVWKSVGWGRDDVKGIAGQTIQRA